MRLRTPTTSSSLGRLDHRHLRSGREDDLALQPREPVAGEVGADRAELVGLGHRAQGEPAGRGPPPTPGDPRGAAAAARARASVTMRVTAMGDTALTVTPGGATRPICQVRAATARLAQP